MAMLCTTFTTVRPF